jgi:hypothetical protein
MKGNHEMTILKKTALAVALLAGSALSPLPLMAQTSSSQTTGSTVLPQQTQQEAPKADTSAEAKPQAGTSGTSSDPAQMKTSTDTQNSAGADRSQSAPSSSAQQAQTDQIKKEDATGGNTNKSASSENAPSGTQQRQSAQGSVPSTDTDATKPTTARNATSPSTDTTAPGSQDKGSSAASANTDRPSNEVTGSINISVEQKTEIRNVIVENRVETVKPSFSVSVGVSVPKTVKLHPLPPKVVEIVPAYRSYQYFLLADNRIVIVDPSSFEIVYILVV